MKKLLLFLALSASSIFAANAQIGINAGYTNDTWDVAMKGTGGGLGMYTRTQGFYAGASYALPLIGDLSFVPGINFNSANGDFFLGGELKTQFIEIPLNFEFRHKISDLFAVIGFAGPGARYALSVKWEDNGENIDLFDNDELPALDNKFDITLSGGIGIEVAGLRFCASYGTGLLNFVSEDLKKEIARRINSTGFRLGVTYVLNF